MDAESDEDLLAVATASVGFLVMATCHEIHQKQHRRRKKWIKSWIRNRSLYGVHSTLFGELRSYDITAFSNYMRMEFSAFQDLLSLIDGHIRKKDTRCRRAITPQERLCVTLRFLASGKNIIH